MNKPALILTIILVSLQTALAQGGGDTLIIDLKYNISVSSESFIKEISIRRGVLKRTKENLLKQCLDSVRLYNGNCFKITYFDDRDTVYLEKGFKRPVYIKGAIYKIDENEKEEINNRIKNYVTFEPVNHQMDSSSDVLTNDNNEQYFTEASKVFYMGSMIFQYGGESKITLLPRMGFYRGHYMKLVKPYYGVELGVHPMMVFGAYTMSGVVGVEKGIFFTETSISHYRTTKIPNGIDYSGPFSQNSVNLKLGIQIWGVGIKIGRSFILSEHIPLGQDRPPLFDLGKINGNIYGIELSIKSILSDRYY